MSSAGEGHPLRPVPRHRYRDFQVAGEGAMGLVYLALDTELNRSVAFKIVRPRAGEADSGATPATPLDASAPADDGAFDQAGQQRGRRDEVPAEAQGGVRQAEREADELGDVDHRNSVVLLKPLKFNVVV